MRKKVLLRKKFPSWKKSTKSQSAQFAKNLMKEIPTTHKAQRMRWKAGINWDAATFSMKDAYDPGSRRCALVPCAESQSLKRSEKEGTQKNTSMLKMIFNTSFNSNFVFCLCLCLKPSHQTLKFFHKSEINISTQFKTDISKSSFIII